MTKYFLRITGLALLWSVPFLGQAPTAAMAGDATCCGNAGCKSCCDCCPHCGCKLVPQCHISCTTKKVTTYKYTCKCDDHLRSRRHTLLRQVLRWRLQVPRPRS